MTNTGKKIIDDSRCRVAGSDVSAAGAASLHQATEVWMLESPLYIAGPRPPRAPAVYCGRGTGARSGRRTLYSTGVRGRVLGAAPLRSGAPVVVLANGGEPEPGDVDATVPVDVVSIQADVDGLLDASCVPMLVLVHALHAVPIGVVTSSPGVLGYR